MNLWDWIKLLRETVKTEKRRNLRTGTQGTAIFRALVEKEEPTEKEHPVKEENHLRGSVTANSTDIKPRGWRFEHCSRKDSLVYLIKDVLVE